MITKHIAFSEEEEKIFNIKKYSDTIEVTSKDDIGLEWTYDTHRVLETKLPGLIVDKEEQYLRSNVYECYSFLVENEIIYCFELVTDNSEPSLFSTISFSSINDFYLYVFQKQLTISIDLCKYLNIISPQQIFLNYLRENNIYLLGYEISEGIDNEGYTALYLSLVKKVDSDKWFCFYYDFPVKDFRPNNKYYDHVEEWAPLMNKITDNSLFTEINEKAVPHYKVLEMLSDKILRSFYKNTSHPYSSEDKEDVAFLNSVLIGCASIDNWE